MQVSRFIAKCRCWSIDKKCETTSAIRINGTKETSMNLDGTTEDIRYVSFCLTKTFDRAFYSKIYQSYLNIFVNGALRISLGCRTIRRYCCKVIPWHLDSLLTIRPAVHLFEQTSFRSHLLSKRYSDIRRFVRQSDRGHLSLSQIWMLRRRKKKEKRETTLWNVGNATTCLATLASVE